MNGKVLVVGGSIDYHGAPVLTALGALNAGADLVYIYVPECNFDAVRSMYPDFIVRKFEGNYLTIKSVEEIAALAKKCDTTVIGPGLGVREETMEAIQQLVKKIETPVLLDAGAIQVLQKIKEFPLNCPVLITPHHNEFETLTGKEVKISSSLNTKVMLTRTLATDLKINILLKGPESLVVSEEGEIVLNETGDSGMTVGGSGDVLSGFIACMMAQGLSPFAAAKVGIYLFGKCGELLNKQKSVCYSASDLAMEIPFVVRNLI